MTTPTLLVMGKDIQGQQSTPFAETPLCNSIVSFYLASNTPVTITVPDDANLVNFTFTKADDVWVNWQGTAIIPSDDSFLLLENGDQLLLENGDNLLLEGFGAVGSTMLNPICKTVNKGDQLSFISTTAAGVCLEFYNKYSTGRN